LGPKITLTPLLGFDEATFSVKVLTQVGAVADSELESFVPVEFFARMK
jgi:hypothetical protein